MWGTVSFDLKKKKKKKEVKSICIYIYIYIYIVEEMAGNGTVYTGGFSGRGILMAVL